MTCWFRNSVLLYFVEDFRYIYLMLCVVGHALIDLLMRSVESPPQVGQKVLCRHPFQESKRAYVNPSRVEPLYKVCLIQTAWLLYLTNLSFVDWCTYRCVLSSSFFIPSHPQSLDGSVGVVTSYRLDSLVFESQQWQQIFSSPDCPDWLWGPPCIILNEYWGSFLGVMLPEH